MVVVYVLRMKSAKKLLMEFALFIAEVPNRPNPGINITLSPQQKHKEEMLTVNRNTKYMVIPLKFLYKCCMSHGNMQGALEFPV